jgi:hypothetical protein
MGATSHVFLTLEQVESSYLSYAGTRFNLKRDVARALGITIPTLNSKLKQAGLFWTNSGSRRSEDVFIDEEVKIFFDWLLNAHRLRAGMTAKQQSQLKFLLDNAGNDAATSWLDPMVSCDPAALGLQNTSFNYIGPANTSTRSFVITHALPAPKPPNPQEPPPPPA